MARFQCNYCEFIYDEAKEDVKFEDLSEDWVCPECGVDKHEFTKIEEKAEAK